VGLGLLLVLGGLLAGLVACPPPAQRLCPGHGGGCDGLVPGRRGRGS
jgi:hypothetical protein